MDISILVNNSAISPTTIFTNPLAEAGIDARPSLSPKPSTDPNPRTPSTSAQLLSTVIAGTIPQLLLTRHLLPSLQTRPHKSAIIDISSADSGNHWPSSGDPAFSAAKAYGHMLNLSLAKDKNNTNVDF